MIPNNFRVNASSSVSPASSSSPTGSVIQHHPIVLDNTKPPPPLDADRMRMHPRIGNRQIVGYGLKGKPEYFDLVMFPCPSIRWEADTPEIAELRKKEQADWKQLSVDDKKQCNTSSALHWLRSLRLFVSCLFSSVSSEFSANVRGVHGSVRHLEMGSRMDVDLVGWSRSRLRWMATHLYGFHSSE
jgi:hypothetical protein